MFVPAALRTCIILGPDCILLRCPYECPQFSDVPSRFWLGNENDSHGLMTFSNISLLSCQGSIKWEVVGCIIRLIFRGVARGIYGSGPHHDGTVIVFVVIVDFTALYTLMGLSGHWGSQEEILRIAYTDCRFTLTPLFVIFPNDHCLFVSSVYDTAWFFPTVLFPCKNSSGSLQASRGTHGGRESGG